MISEVYIELEYINDIDITIADMEITSVLGNGSTRRFGKPMTQVSFELRWLTTHGYTRSFSNQNKKDEVIHVYIINLNV